LHATYDELETAAQMKRSDTFEALRMARLRMGTLRYGVTGWTPEYDLVLRMQRCIDAYLKTGNREMLIDLANFAELEWVHPSREGTYYEAVDR